MGLRTKDYLYNFHLLSADPSPGRERGSRPTSSGFLFLAGAGERLSCDIVNLQESFCIFLK